MYGIDDEFDQNTIIGRMRDMTSDLEEEQAKTDEEFDRDREFRLIYRHFMEGLKLSTGSIMF